ncbi:MAG: beta-propeller fold lactonase family protein [Terriglobales bacterium]
MAAAISLVISTCGYGANQPLIPRFAYVANNQDDTISIFAIRQSNLRPAGYVYSGSGSNPRAIVVTPSQSFLYVAEGNIGIGAYAINTMNGSLTLVSGSPFLTGAEFSIVMHPSGKFLIAVTGSALVVYTINPNTGALTSVQTVAGDSPISAAIDPKGLFLFAANVNSNSVSAFTINQSSGILTPVTGSPFASGRSPQSVVIEHQGKFLYLPNGNDASVSAYGINPTTGALTEIVGSPFATGSVPVAAVSKKSFLYVGNSADKTVSQYSIDSTTGALTQIAAPFSTGTSGPLGLTVSPDEPLLYVADHDSDEVIVLGMFQNGVLFNESSVRTRGNPLSIALASGNAAVAYSPKYVYECNETSNDVWGYGVTAATGSLAALGGSPFSPAGNSPQSVASDLNGKFLFTANSGSNNVSAFTINPQTGVLVPVPGSPFPAGTNPSTVAVDISARFVYVTNSGSNSISEYSVDPNGALTVLPGSPFAISGSAPRAVAIDPRGKFVYVAQSNTILILEIDAQTGALQSISSVSTGSSVIAVAVASDGKYLYALNGSSGSVYAYGIDPVTGQLSSISGSPFAGSGSSNSIFINPLGKRLYVGNTSTIRGYRLFDNLGNLAVLPQSPYEGVAVASGLAIDQSDSFLYAANNSGNSISGFQVDAASGALTPLTTSPYEAGANPASITVVNNIQ